MFFHSLQRRRSSGSGVWLVSFLHIVLCCCGVDRASSQVAGNTGNWREWHQHKGALCQAPHTPAYSRLALTTWNGLLAIKYSCTKLRFLVGPDLLVCHEDGKWKARNETYTQSPSCASCQGGEAWKWNSIEKKCQAVVANPEAVTWSKARLGCMDFKGELASIQNVQSQSIARTQLFHANRNGIFVRKNPTEREFRLGDSWFGLLGSLEGGSSTWRWNATGRVSTYVNWQWGSEPMFEEDSPRLCGILKEDKAIWDAVHCTYSAYTLYFCQRPGVPDCGAHPTLTHGRSNVSENGGTVTYQCNTGYTFQNVTTSTLTLSCSQSGLNRGMWLSNRATPIVPMCKIVTCGDPGHVSHAHRAGTSFNYGDQISYACHHGYVAEGRQTTFLTCRANGNWSATIPVCERLHCPSPGRGKNSIMQGSNFSFTGQVSYKCIAGFFASSKSRRTIQCLGDGTWSNPALNCKECDCNELFTTNEVCNWITGECLCRHDISATGPRCEQCKDGSFRNDSESTPCEQCDCVTSNTINRNSVCNNQTGQCDCRKDFTGLTCSDKKVYSCGDPGQGVHAHRSGKHFTHGSKVHFHCKHGYRYDNAHHVKLIKCFKNMTWSGTPPECRPVQCKDPVSDATTQHITWRNQSAVFTFGDRVLYRCNPGYRVQGGHSAGEQIECIHNGSWSASPLTCEACICNRTFTDDAVCEQRTGKCLCNHKMNAAGPTCSECRDGMFRSNLGECVLCDCIAPNTINGSVCNSVTGRCQCKAAYHTGRRCESPRCPDPGHGKHAIRLSGYAHLNLTPSTRLYYSCKAGFAVDDPAIIYSGIQCLQNGTWSADPPSCKKCKCNQEFDRTLPNICNGRTGKCLCDHKNHFTGLMCETCEDGYFISNAGKCERCACTSPNTVPGSICNKLTGQCQCKETYHVGRTCATPHCPKPDEGVNAVLVNKPKTFTPSTRAYYRCQHGHFAKNSHVLNNGITCQANGTWSSEPLKCIRCDCNQEFNYTQPEICNSRTGKCFCDNSKHISGSSCQQCEKNSYRPAEEVGACKWCLCLEKNTLPNTECNRVTGQCKCRDGCSGLNCGFCDQYCPEFNDDTQRGLMNFPKTPVFESVSVTCPHGPRCGKTVGNFSRTCLLGPGMTPTWGDMFIVSSRCNYKDKLAVEMECNFPKTITGANVGQIAGKLVDLVKNRTLSGGAVDQTANILDRVVGVKTQDKSIGGAVADVLSKVIGSKSAQDGDSEQATGNKLLNIAEEYAGNSPMGNDLERIFSSENLAIRMLDIDSDELPNINITSNFANKDEEPRVEVRLPKGLPVKGRQRLQVVKFDQPTLFRETNLSNATVHEVNSLVVSVKIGAENISGLKEPIQLKFLLNRDDPSANQSCVYWDFEANAGAGAWSDKGCTMISKTEQAAGKIIATCECNHLTHFAIMMDLDPNQQTSSAHEDALSYITYIGCSLSLLGLLGTFIILALFKKLRQQRQMQIIGHMCLAWTGALVMFIAGVGSTESKKACTALAILLHYFLLVVFLWTFMQAFYLYMVLVRVYSQQMKGLITKMAIITWGVPLVIVATTVGATEVEAYEPAAVGRKICVLNMDTAREAFIGSFLAPICLILFVNCIIFIRVMGTIIKPRPGSTKRTMQENKRDVKVAVSLGVLLGFTWLFGLGMAGDAKIAFQYIFTILNSLLGFFIFILHLGLRRDFHEEVKSKISRSKSEKSFNSRSSRRTTMSKVSSQNSQLASTVSSGLSTADNITPISTPARTRPISAAGSQPSADSGAGSSAGTPPEAPSPTAVEKSAPSETYKKIEPVGYVEPSQNYTLHLDNHGEQSSDV